MRWILKLISLIVDERRKARKEKKWEKSDMIRDRLAELGIKLEDQSGGVTVGLE